MLELMREADMILDACGRPTPPAGYRFVDLPRCIPFSATQTSLGEGSNSSIPYPYANRVQNSGNTLFLCRGLSTNTALNFRVKWPNGRYMAQNVGKLGSYLSGSGSNQFALNNEQPIEAGKSITVEVADAVNGGTLQVGFWGVLRYLMKDTSGGRQPLGGTGCIVGYPAEIRPDSLARQSRAIVTMPDPIQELRNRPRYWCGPNQNIMAPEALLGNQRPQTPAGFVDEPYTFFSNPITVGLDGHSLNNPVLMSGNEDIVIYGVRPMTTYAGDVFAVPIFSIRTPSGYSVSGGDLIPHLGFQWLPFFRPLATRAGDRLIIDVSNIDGSGEEGSLTTTFEFSAVKRRRAS